MTISEKLTAVAENQPKLYDTGFAAGQQQGWDTGYGKGLADGQAMGGYADGFTAGEKAQYDAFWDAFQQAGSRTDYERAFRGAWWNDESFCPKYDITPQGNVPSIFQNCGVTDLKGICNRKGIALNFSGTTQLTYPFQSSSITRLPLMDFSNINDCATVFNGAKALEWVDGVVLREDGSQTFGTGVGYHAFLYAAKLTHCPITGKIGKTLWLNSSAYLDTETVASIIEALKDLTGQTAQTLTLHKTVGGKLTDAQKAVITAKNWTLVY